MRIIGIDPGYGRVGVAIVERVNGKDNLLFSVLIETSSKIESGKRLQEISQDLEKIFSKWTPDALYIEALFMTQNKKTVVGVAEARGVILAVAGKYGVPAFEISPPQVKLAIAGYGKAEKSAVARMVPRLVKLPIRKINDDEMDAIAIALAGTALYKN